MNTLTIKNRGDIIDAVPAAIGFHPTDSLVMLSFGSPSGGPHARVDLLDDPAEQASILKSFVQAVTINQVTSALIVTYNEDGSSHPLSTMLAEVLTTAGVTVHDVVTARNDEHGSNPNPDGKPVADDRTELERELAPDGVVDEEGTTRSPGLVITMLVDAGVEDCYVPDVLATLADNDLRDQVLDGISRDEAPRAMLSMIAVLRRTPDQHRANAAAVLSFLCWRAGDGARAWAAHDVSVANGGCRLATIMNALLTNAVPPSAYDEVAS